MAKKDKKGRENPVLATNRAASHDYFLISRIEAGIALTGTEVKSVREGRINLKESYCRVKGGEIYLHQAHISPYSHGSPDQHDPVRVRKLLLHAREIRKLAKQIDSAGMSLIPTKAYLRNGRVKIEIAVARGKRAYDKRETKKRKEAEREMARLRSERG